MLPMAAIIVLFLPGHLKALIIPLATITAVLATIRLAARRERAHIYRTDGRQLPQTRTYRGRRRAA